MLDLDFLISDDGSKAVISAERFVLHRPTGIAAFPDGGPPKVTDQIVDVYVVDLASKKILYRHAIDPPGEGSMQALETWPLGWQGDDVYVKLASCLPGFWTSYKGCNGERRKTYVYKISSRGVDPAAEPSPPLPRHENFAGTAGPDAPHWERSYLSTTDGVWIQHGAKGPREPLLRLNGQDLEQVVD